MPIATPNNNFLLAVAKQTDESTISSTATYSVPVYSANVGPVYDDRRIEVTDASSIQGDFYKGQTYWTAETEFPAFGTSLGRFLQSMWPTDTTTGAGPYTHTFSGLGGTQPWVALYTEWPGAGAFEQTFGKGTATSFGITANADGGPARVRFGAMGQTPSKTNYTVTTADALTGGYFTLQHASATIEADFDTPNVNPSGAITNVTQVSIDVARSATPVLTADGIGITYIGAGKVVPSGSLTMAYSSWDAYQASYFGSVSGTAVSSTVVTGALALNFKHTVQSGWSLEIYVPAVQFKVATPVPSPSGDVLTHEVTLNIQAPSSGSHVVPVLTNSTSAAY